MISQIQSLGFEEKKLFTGEININYAAGPNNGPALVLIPGQTVSWENYEKVLEPLSKSFCPVVSGPCPLAISRNSLSGPVPHNFKALKYF
ncbi:MAG: hypothetical protein Q7I94_05180, partial [Candidatus Contubernalis sp.]|nr:hypothetical protein [Candidatus Contubernalis sp.]